MNKLIYEVLPVITKDEKQPCLACLFRDQCNGTLDFEYVWINEEYALLICAWRMRDLYKRKIREVVKVLVKVLKKKVKAK